MDVFEVIITKWSDSEGIEKREIGRITLHETPTTDQVSSIQYVVTEGSHPHVPTSARARGTIHDYPIRQSVWRMVEAAIGAAFGQGRHHQ